MSSNEQPLDNGSITPPPADCQKPSPVEDEPRPTPPGWRPEVDVPQRRITQRPRWPHPNFWWSILWCILFLFVTQIPGGVIAVVIALALPAVAPEQFPNGPLSSPAGLLKSDAMSVGLAVGIGITELLVVGFSLLIIRLVVGRDWMRQLALRPPGAAHTLLAEAVSGRSASAAHPPPAASPEVWGAVRP